MKENESGLYCYSWHKELTRYMQSNYTFNGAKTLEEL